MAVDIRPALKKMVPYLLKAREDNLNEADTVQRIIKVFEDALGYDAMSELTSEAKVKDKYVDLAVKLDGVIRFLVEAKSAATVLRDRHIEQAQNYAAHSNIPWVLLTNGVQWNLYHLSFEEGIEYVRVFELDLAEDSLDKAGELLGYLHRQSLKKNSLDDYWEKRVALSPQSIADAIFLERTLKFIRRELRRNTGLLIDEEDLAREIHGMLSTEARELIGPVKIRRKKSKKSLRARSASQENTDVAAEAKAAAESD